MRWLTRHFGGGRTARRGAAPGPPVDSTTAAALVQRLTGPGSGPYSGTPFLPAEAAERPTDAREGSRHDHGIIDHSRHVSSIGRR